MNKNIEATRQWYIEHELEAEFHKLYVCSHCKYFGTCTGVADEVRITCEAHKDAGGMCGASETWGQMSYHKEYIASSRTVQRRLRDGE